MRLGKEKSIMIHGLHEQMKRKWHPTIMIFILSLSGKTFEKKKKKGLNPFVDSAQIVIFVFTTKSRITWAKVHIFSDSRYMDS